METVTTLHKGRVFTLQHEKVVLPNGRQTGLDVIRHPGASAMICLTENREVLMLNQHRHAAGGSIWEIPAGTLEPGESPLDCAAREIEEETGYKASRWEKLGQMFPAPGYTDEIIHIYLGTGLTRSSQNLDADEILEVHALPLDKVLDMAADGTIRDAKTLCALFWLIRRREM